MSDVEILLIQLAMLQIDLELEFLDRLALDLVVRKCQLLKRWIDLL